MKYKLTQNSMRLREVEVQYGFASGNLFVSIFYKSNSQYGVVAHLGGNEGEILVLMHQDTRKGFAPGAVFRLFLTRKEQAVSNGPGFVRSADYCGTHLYFCPAVLEAELKKAKRAKRIVD